MAVMCMHSYLNKQEVLKSNEADKGRVRDEPKYVGDTLKGTSKGSSSPALHRSLMEGSTVPRTYSYLKTFFLTRLIQ